MQRPYSLDSTRRIKRSREFRSMRDASHRIYSKHFVVLIEENNGPVSRLGVTVSSRIDKRAVQRNRMKRLLRETFRHLQNKLRGSFDIVIIARKNVNDASCRDVERELLRAFAQAKLLIHE